MLDELAVANLGLIRHARIEPGPGLVAVTGETGAGKTLLLGALRLLRGDQARSDRIGPHGDEARVEGRFLLGDGEFTVSRRVGEGRSRAYLDGVMTPANALADRLGGTVEIVGQNEHVALGSDRAARAVVDAVLDPDGVEARHRYFRAWTALSELAADRDSLGGDRRALERELDLYRHQAGEIAASRLRPGEDIELAAGLARLRNAEEIAADLAHAHGALGEDGAGGALGDAVDASRRAAALDPSLLPVVQRLEAAAAEIGDLAADMRRAAEGLEHDPAALEAAEQRAAAVAELRRKYGDTLQDVISYGEEAAAAAHRLESLMEHADSLAASIADAEKILAAAGAELTAARRTAAARLAESAIAHLTELGFRTPVVRIDVVPAEPGPAGCDRVRLLFASDAALEPGPVGRVASGGELSRLVLAISLASGVGEAPVVVFDEVDAGVGGATALAMGRKLADLSLGRQVLVVTHLPQVAAFADAHFVVERAGTEAVVQRVEGEARLAELTRMLGGLPDSERGRSHAAELMALRSGGGP